MSSPAFSRRPSIYSGFVCPTRPIPFPCTTVVSFKASSLFLSFASGVLSGSWATWRIMGNLAGHGEFPLAFLSRETDYRLAAFIRPLIPFASLQVGR